MVSALPIPSSHHPVLQGGCCTIPLCHPTAPSLRSIPLLHPACPSHRAGHVCCGRWHVSLMAMTTSWDWRSRRRGASGISLISLTLLLMQLTSLLLLLSSGLGPKIQSGGGKSTKRASGYLQLAPESKLAGKSLPPTISYPLVWVFTPQEGPSPTPAPPVPSTPPVVGSLLFPAGGWFSGCWFLESLPV